MEKCLDQNTITVWSVTGGSNQTTLPYSIYTSFLPLTPHPSALAPRPSSLAYLAPCSWTFAPGPSPLARWPSRLTTHPALPIILHPSTLTSHPSTLTSHPSTLKKSDETYALVDMANISFQKIARRGTEMTRTKFLKMVALTLNTEVRVGCPRISLRSETEAKRSEIAKLTP